MNQFQLAAIAAYPDGELLAQPPLGLGDTLFTFVVTELSDKEDCLTLDDAIRRMETAVSDLNRVLEALEALE